jgi:histidinol-phosphatase (PHP family)
MGSAPLFDYHVHSEFSVDCKIPVTEMCRAAIAAGVTEIVITDHVDHEPADPGTGYYHAEAYFQSIERARAEFGDQLVVLAGAEVDFNRRIAGEVERFLSQHDYDFVIGSVHYGEGGEIIFPEFFAAKTLDDVFLPYFDEIEAAVDTGLFDTVGHLDLPKRYAPRTHRTYDPLTYRERLQPIFAKLIRQGMSFEINTSGIRQAPKTSMPGPAIVRWYVEAGGTLITTGTDSHAPQTVGAGLATTMDMLQLCGIDAISSFRRRRRTQVPIARLRQQPEVLAV